MLRECESKGAIIVSELGMELYFSEGIVSAFSAQEIAVCMFTAPSPPQHQHCPARRRTRRPRPRLR